MEIQLGDEERARRLEDIRSWFREELEVDLGELRARLVLDFFLERLGPAVRDAAVAEAVARLQEKVLDLEAEMQQSERGPRS